jgi:DNA topoisomerase IA
MKIVLITEKPSLGKCVIQQLLDMHPDLDIDAFSMGYTGFHMHLNSAFAFPRGEAYSTFPKTGEIGYREFSFTDTRHIHHLPKRGIIINCEAEGRTDHFPLWSQTLSHEEFVSDIMQADIVYFAVDPGPSGFYAQLRTVEFLSEFNHKLDRRHLVLFDLTDESIRNGIREAGPLADLRERSHMSMIRRYFDYNYMHNAFPILGLTAQRALGRPLESMLTKHELQVLFYLRGHSGLKDGTLLAAMRRWVGSGRYTRDADIYFTGVGSPATSHGIVKNLINERLAERVGKTGIEISEEGRRFLDFLHPDCEDVDQVFRIHEFSKMPEEEAKAKVDRYIMTFFGKQKRYLPKITRQMG